jgi:hypothetical protein
MPIKGSETASDRVRHERALSRWDNEGGSGPDGHEAESAPRRGLVTMPEIGQAEMGALHIRVIALENLVVALLVNASDNQLVLARDMAGFVAPREGFTQHPLTTRAATHMVDLVERAARFRCSDFPQAKDIK